jgi:hypothetical protein
VESQRPPPLPSLTTPRKRRCLRSAVGKVELPQRRPKPRAPCAIANCNVTPAGPTHPAAPMRRRPHDAPCARERPLPSAERGLRSNEPRRAASPPDCRPRDRTPQRTGALAAAQGQPPPEQGPRRASKPPPSRASPNPTHKRRKPKPRWLGLLVVVGHSGLEPEANGLRIHCSTN